MKISVFGSGYVGLVQAAVLAEVGHDVLCMDIDRNKVERLAQAGKVDPAAERFYGALAAYGRFLLATLAERAA